MTAVPVQGTVRLISGGPATIAALGEAITAARGPVLGEVYQVARPVLVDQLTAAAHRGLPVALLYNRATFTSAADAAVLHELAQAGVSTIEYGAGHPVSLWQHAKTWHFAGATPEAWITNLALIPQSNMRSELSVIVTGPAAEGVRELTRSALAGRPAALRGAALDAARAGVLVNDPVSGTFHLTSTLADLVESARDELLVATKTLDDVSWTRRIVAAAQRGAAVSVHVRDVTPEDAALLEGAAIPVSVLAKATPRWRPNVVVADGRAYVGSAFFWPPMVGGASGTTRDTGVLLDGSNALAARTAALDLLASTSGAMTLDAARAAGLLAGAS